MTQQTLLDPGARWHPGQPEGVLTAGVAAARGAVHSLNQATLSTESEYYLTKAPTTADIVSGVPCVSQGTYAQGASGLFKMFGYTNANVSLTAEALAVGQVLVFINAAQHFVTAAGAGVDAKIVAKSMEAVSSTTAVVNVRVCLFGEAGCGILEA